MHASRLHATSLTLFRACRSTYGCALRDTPGAIGATLAWPVSMRKSALRAEVRHLLVQAQLSLPAPRGPVHSRQQPALTSPRMKGSPGLDHAAEHHPLQWQGPLCCSRSMQQCPSPCRVLDAVHKNNYLPPVNWRWFEEGDGYVRHCSLPAGGPLDLPQGNSSGLQLQCQVPYPYRTVEMQAVFSLQWSGLSHPRRSCCHLVVVIVSDGYASCASRLRSVSLPLCSLPAGPWCRRILCRLCLSPQS
jgi:hypothetical protein